MHKQALPVPVHLLRAKERRAQNRAQILQPERLFQAGQPRHVRGGEAQAERLDGAVRVAHFVYVLYVADWGGGGGAGGGGQVTGQELKQARRV